jgi:hypothetical protein
MSHHTWGVRQQTLMDVLQDNGPLHGNTLIVLAMDRWEDQRPATHFGESLPFRWWLAALWERMEEGHVKKLPDGRWGMYWHTGQEGTPS